MASDKSMYWLAAVVLAFGLGTRYGHGNSANEWIACAFSRTTHILDGLSDQTSAQAERAVVVMEDHGDCLNDRAGAIVARAQARAEAMIARREAASTRVQAALARVDDNVMRIEIEDIQ